MASSSSSKGIGFVGLLTISFVVLKLCGVINWSWWWVLSPIWINILLVILLIVVYAIIATIQADRRNAREKKKYL